MIGDPVGLPAEENVVHGVDGVTAVGHLFESRKALFATAAQIVELDVGVVADIGDIVRVKEGAVVRELRRLVAVAEAPGLVADVAGEGDSFAGRQGLFEGINGVQVAWCRADEVKRTIESDLTDRLSLIGEMDLRDRLVGLVLESYADVSVEGAAVRVDIDGGIDGGDLGLEEVFVLFELAFVIGLNVASRLGV